MGGAKYEMKTTKGVRLAEIFVDGLIYKGEFSKTEVLKVTIGAVLAEPEQGGTNRTGTSFGLKLVKYKEKYETEKKFLEQLKACPSIVQIEDLIEFSSFNYWGIFFPYFALDGTEFEHKPKNQVQLYMNQILQALQFLHLHSLVHCDIKPENILIQSETNLKVVLTDFELVQPHDKKIEKYNFGTLFYKAPEIIEKKSQNFHIQLICGV